MGLGITKKSGNQPKIYCQETRSTRRVAVYLGTHYNNFMCILCSVRLQFTAYVCACYSERELKRSRSLYAVAPSICLSSVTLVHPTQTVVIFGNFATTFGTLTYTKNFTEIAQGNPFVGGVKHNRGSQI